MKEKVVLKFKRLEAKRLLYFLRDKHRKPHARLKDLIVLELAQSMQDQALVNLHDLWVDDDQKAATG